MKSLYRGLDKVKLRALLALFFLALAVPAAILIGQAYSQLKWEAVHRHRELAAELANRIDSDIATLIDAEESRSFADYSFLVVSGSAASNFLQRSPLSAYPVGSAFPGLVGYFQVDAEGRFSTPLVPDDSQFPQKFGISQGEYEQRQALNNQIRQVLADNRLVGTRSALGQAAVTTPPALEEALANAAGSVSSPQVHAREEQAPETAVRSDKIALETSTSQMAFDRLEQSADEQLQAKAEGAGSLGRVEDLELDQSYRDRNLAKERRQRPAERETERTPARSKRKEQIYLPDSKAAAAEPLAEIAAEQFDVPILAFEGEIDPFAFSLLDSGHLVLFRKVWRQGQRYIQGLLIDREPFFQGLIGSAYRETSLAQMSDLIVAYQGEVMEAFRASGGAAYGAGADLAGTVLYQSALSAPLSTVELIFTVTRLPSGPGAAVINWVAVILGAVLVGGCLLLYRLGVGQIELARQQQDFVSAVSHELKTPLTSIRMYGEMLREGWADEGKKRTYYEYIYAESERLSRLIANVLQLARMTRNETEPDLKPVTVAEALDLVRSKVASPVERAGFELKVECTQNAGARTLEIDADGLVQVFINLIDNALKFAAAAECKTIELRVTERRGDRIAFGVRDYGPGVPKGQLKKIFRLFYRSENELTRETVGTGIGLALVNQLVQSMGGEVDARNRDPGVEFQVLLPAHPANAELVGEPNERSA